MARPLFQLGPRLGLCAALARGGRALCDVGCDHAYLPIWLLKTGWVDRAIGCDNKLGPLAAARENARRYLVEDRLSLRLSDGLAEVAPGEADRIVIAGMGGELILRIVQAAPWLRDPAVCLVLQPMSAAEDLRRGLLALGFSVETETAVLDAGRHYSAFAAAYTGQTREEDPLFPYLGKLSPGDPAARAYADRVLRDLRGRLEGARRGRGTEDPEALEAVIREIGRRFFPEEEQTGPAQGRSKEDNTHGENSGHL